MSNDGTGLREWAEHTEALREIAAYYASWDRPQAHKVAALTAAITAMQAAPVAWIPVAERLPDSLKPALLCVEYASGKRRVIRAIYAAANTLELGDDQEWWPGCTEDEHENVYVPAGWYERNEYEETSWHVNDKAVAWQALPPPPTGE